MRNLGSAADQHWAVPKAGGDSGVAADPRRAGANGLELARRETPNAETLNCGHHRDTVLRRLFWSLVLLVPVIGWVFYGGLYRPPPRQPKDVRAPETLGIY